MATVGLYLPFRSILFCWFIFSQLLQVQSQADRSLKCFACESREKGKCSDSFHTTGVKTHYCKGSCVKVVNRFNELRAWSRYCHQDYHPDGCNRTNSESGFHLECFCNTNLCNGASLPTFFPVISVYASALVWMWL